MTSKNLFLPSDPLTIGYNALFRPARFAAFLGGGRRNMLAAVVATLLWVGAALAFVGLVLPHLVPINPIDLLAGLLLAPVMAMLISGALAMTGDKDLEPPWGTLFWVLRCQLTVTPWFALCAALGFTESPRWLVVVLLLLFGFWLGGGLGVVFMRNTPHTTARRLRWLLALGTLALIGLLWWSPVFPFNQWGAVFLCMLGFASGLLGLLTWLGEAPVAGGLWLAARLGLPLSRLRALHPATLDELVLLPLPGLQALLVRACTQDLATGGRWLLDIARHPGQRGAALGALRSIIRRGTLAHPLLRWLSSHPDGQGWLRLLLATADRLPPLVRGAVALMDVDYAGTWPATIANHRAAFVQAQHAPGGASLLALLDTASAVLGASTWPAALAAVQALPADPAPEPDDIQQALVQLRQIATADDDTALEHAAALSATTPAGWSGSLLDATTEHLVFLLLLEECEKHADP